MTENEKPWEALRRIARSTARELEVIADGLESRYLDEIAAAERES